MAIMSLIVLPQSEVNDINKQRFLPELGKLLTFMVEDDRQTALAMYSRLFDDAEDEQKLMDLLVSPTRQAVVIARSYDARERKQQLEAASPGEAVATPAFVLTLDKIYQQVAPRHVEAPPPETQEIAAAINQFSLFPDDAHPIDDSEYVPFQIEADAVPIEGPVEELPVEAEPAAPVEDMPEATPAERLAEADEADPAAADALPEAVPAAAAAAPQFDEPDAVSEPEPAQILPEGFDLDQLSETKRKPKVFLLILYVLLAIPVTLAGIVLLLIPTVLALALAVLVIVVGSAALVAAFSGFPKLADILIVLGGAVIVLALGLLLLWLFVWFVGGAIGGLIRSVIELGRKWCYVEVPA